MIHTLLESRQNWPDINRLRLNGHAKEKLHTFFYLYRTASTGRYLEHENISDYIIITFQ